MRRTVARNLSIEKSGDARGCAAFGGVAACNALTGGGRFVNQHRQDAADRELQPTHARVDSHLAERELDFEQLFGGRSPTSEMAEVLLALQMLAPRPFERVDAMTARRQPGIFDAMLLLQRERGESTDPEDVGSVYDDVIPGLAGDMPIRVYVPASSGVADRALPVVVYFHNGGWVTGSLDSHDASARAIANAVPAVVISCAYRLAPEDRFPAAHQDAYAAYRHVALHTRLYGGDPQRIAIAGEGSGANLAAVCCLNARLEGVREPVHQVLLYPVADSVTQTESYIEMESALPLSSATMRWYFSQYLQRPAQGETPAISLLRAAALQGMPPATVICAELDPLRSEGEALADHLARSRVAVTQRTYAGVTHDFFGLGAVLTPARDAQRFVGERLRDSFLHGGR